MEVNLMVDVDELTYEELREVQKKERSTGMLSELPGDFYEKAGRLISRLKGEVNAEFGLEKAREYENALKVVREIYSMREQKILLRALRASKGTNDIAGITAGEREVFEKVKDSVVAGQADFEKRIGNSSSLPDVRDDRMVLEVESTRLSLAKPARQEIPAEAGRKLKVLSAVPQFMGLDGKKYGPFKAGEVVFLPEKEGELLLKRKMAAEG